MLPTFFPSLSYASTDNDRAQLARLDVRSCIDDAFARDLDLGETRSIAFEPVMLRIEKQQYAGAPDPCSECEALNENESVFDLGRFWAIQSDDFAVALASDIEARAPWWIGTNTDAGCAVDWSRDSDDLEGDLIGAIRRFISDFVSILDYRSTVQDLPCELRDELCGARGSVRFKIMSDLGDYDASINSIEFAELDAALDFARENLGEWLDDCELNFAACMLATSDRSGLIQLRNRLPYDAPISLDNVFDRWVHLA